MVNLFKGSDKIRKRKQSEDEGLSNVKRTTTDHLAPIGSNTVDTPGEADSGHGNSRNTEAANQTLRTECQPNQEQQNTRDEGDEVFTQEPYAPSNQKRSHYELAKYT